MFYSIFSFIDRIRLINLDSFHWQPNTKKSNKYTFSKKITVVSFIIATGSIFLAIPSVIAQSSTSQENTNNSSRILKKIKDEGVLNWGYREGSPPVSDKKNSLTQSAGLCAELIPLLKEYLKNNQLVNQGFEIKQFPVPYPERYEGIKAKELDIECGANTIRIDPEGMKFSDSFAFSKTKILILKSKEKLFDDALKSQNNYIVKFGVLENSTSKPKIDTFFPNNRSIKYFKTKGDAIDALEKGKIDGFVNDEILLVSLLRDISNSQKYEIYSKELGREPYGLALPDDDSMWVDTINSFIRENETKLKELQKKYIDDKINDYRENETEPNRPENLVVLGLLLLGIGLVLGIIDWIWIEKQEEATDIIPFENGYALLIGVGTCEDSRLSLPVTVKDVQAIRNTLVDPRFCAYSNDENHILLLHDQEATRQNILDGLDWLKRQTEHDPDATVTIYFSGHGCQGESDEKTDKCYYLLPHNTNMNDLQSTALSSKDFNEKLGQITSKRLLVIVDSCHAAGMASSKYQLKKQPFSKILSDLKLTEKAYPQIDNGKGIAVFTSSNDSESSWILPCDKMSIYTYHLIEALQGKGNKRSDNSVKVSDLMSYLGAKVPKSAKKFHYAEQNPNFDFNKANDFTIARLKK